MLVKEQTSKKIYIIGQVGQAGTFTYTPSMSVVEAITLAGGFTPIAAKNDTTITRNEDGKKTIVKVPVDDIGRARRATSTCARATSSRYPSGFSDDVRAASAR